MTNKIERWTLGLLVLIALSVFLGSAATSAAYAVICYSVETGESCLPNDENCVCPPSPNDDEDPTNPTPEEPTP